jgi:FemAB-related protein (PEP-CTERM system-associated)
MNIRLYQDTDRQNWDDYVLRHPQGTFFHLIGWKRVLEDSFGHRSFYLVAEKEKGESARKQVDRAVSKKSIVGVFPLFSIKSLLFGRSMVSVPFANYGGILAESPDMQTALYQKAVELTTEQNLDYLEIRNQNGTLPDLPVKDLYYSFKREIFPSEEENLKAIPRKSRRMVRVGMGNGLESAWGGEELLDEYYELLSYSYRGFGTPVFSKRYLKNLLREFGDSVRILNIRKDGKALAGVLTFFFRNEVIPYYSGAYPASREYAANDYLYWALICIARERGCRSFDFGRSKKDTGPYHFKKHWGFEPRPLPYQYYLHGISELPNISPANPKYRRRIEMWKKLPLWATRLIGPRIVKYIP